MLKGYSAIICLLLDIFPHMRGRHTGKDTEMEEDTWIYLSFSVPNTLSLQASVTYFTRPLSVTTQVAVGASQ